MKQVTVLKVCIEGIDELTDKLAEVQQLLDAAQTKLTDITQNTELEVSVKDEKERDKL